MKIRVVDYVMQFLLEKGSDKIFVLTGNGAMYINDAIAKVKKIKYFCVRHECAAPMMAESFARLTGRMGVVCVTAGPGATNTVSGLAEAWVDSAPVLVLSGQSPTNQIPKQKLRSFGTAGFDIIPVVKPMTKYAITIKNPLRIKYCMEKAYYEAMSNRPGPVWIDIPMNIQYALIDPVKLEGFKPPFKKKQDIRNLKFSKLNSLLSSSKKPLIIAGQGIRQSNSIDIFNKLIKILDIPFVLSRLANDIFPFSKKNNMGQVGRRGQKYSKSLLNQADLIIVLGCRLAPSLAGENLNHFNRKANVVMIDVDKKEINFHKKNISLFFEMNLNIFLKLFIEKIQKNKLITKWVDWRDYCEKLKHSNTIIDINSLKKTKPIDLYFFMSCLDRLANKNDVLTTDAGSNYYVGGQVYRFENGQREITSGAYAAMGLSIPLSIGAAVARPKSQILAVTGDGSLELNIQELKTISYYKFNIKLFVINNGGYVSMRNWQDKFFDGRRIGSDDETGAEMLDLYQVSKAFDLPYQMIDDPMKIVTNIKSILKKQGPVFIEVVCSNVQEIIQPYLETKLSS